MNSVHRVLTEEEQKTNEETRKHIDNVKNFLFVIVDALLDRGLNHDSTKLEDPELPLFTEMTPKLAASTYNSDEYKDFLKKLKPALDHHYAKNKHHPEHYPNGINDMTLVDLIEMFCDWASACKRHDDGNLLKSLSINEKRFGISPQLTNILRNTAALLEL